MYENHNHTLIVMIILGMAVSLSFSFAVTLLAITPSSLKLLKTPTFWQFKLALVTKHQHF